MINPRVVTEMIDIVDWLVSSVAATETAIDSTLSRAVDTKTIDGMDDIMSGVGVTKDPFVDISAYKNFDHAKVPIKFVRALSYFTGATAAQLRRHLSNINVIFNS